ncbi:MAG: choloylglycine hydrolase [Clostridia bacterium]|nr:choloylglycine hydrolase [Clostridia bacterium]
MCTSISFLTKDHYFGRNLDMELSYGEKVIITPRKYPLKFRMADELKEHFAFVGVGIVIDNYPLYYDATNEKGLSIAGLNFHVSAVYYDKTDDKNNIGAFELIPWILSQCSSVDEARDLLVNTNVVGIDFSEEYQSTPLHWMISDKDYSITLECVQDGMKVYYNPIHVLTNNPEFPMQVFNLNNYINLTREEPETRFAEGFDLNKYSRGMGAIGLPGDLSSMSRFVRGAFARLNSLCGDTEGESISQFFHILDSVSQTQGCVKTENGFERTIYSSCCNTDKGIYYYKTYNNSQISAVNMYNENLDMDTLITYDIIDRQQIKYLN